MRINTSTHYAISMMQYLAANKRIVSSTELSKNLNISQRYAMQIIAKLRDGGLISTTTGMSGGYTLLQEPLSINLYDVILLMEGDIMVHETNTVESQKRTRLDGALGLLKDYVGTYLSSITLDKLTDKAADEWQIVLADMVETHIAELKQNI